MIGSGKVIKSGVHGEDIKLDDIAATQAAIPSGATASRALYDDYDVRLIPLNRRHDPYPPLGPPVGNALDLERQSVVRLLLLSGPQPALHDAFVLG